MCGECMWGRNGTATGEDGGGTMMSGVKSGVAVNKSVKSQNWYKELDTGYFETV